MPPQMVPTALALARGRALAHLPTGAAPCYRLQHVLFERLWARQKFEAEGDRCVCSEEAGKVQTSPARVPEVLAE